MHVNCTKRIHGWKQYPTIYFGDVKGSKVEHALLNSVNYHSVLTFCSDLVAISFLFSQY